MGVRLVIETNAEGYEPERIVLELDQPRITLGRANSCDVLLPHPSVSSQHATLRQSGTGYGVIDERSTNGVRVGDARLPPERAKPLRSGDVIRIGPYRLVVTLGIPVPKATTADEATALARRLVLQPTGSEGPSRSLTFANGPRTGERIALPDGSAELRVGRAEDAELSLDDSECSRHHATLLVEANSVFLRDEGSKNGVLVQGKPITTRRLRDRDELRVGATLLVYEDAREAAIVTNAKLGVDEPPPAEATPHPESEDADGGPSEAAEAGVIETMHGDDGAGIDIVEGPASPAPAPNRRASSADVTDRLIYGLALLVLGLSVGAIVWLFGSR